MHNIKKIAISLMLLAVMLIGVAGQTPITAEAAGLKLNKKAVSVKTGKTVRLKLNRSVVSVKWKSADTSIATVSNGRVTGVSVGNTVVTATCRQYNGRTKKLRCKVYVKSSRYLRNPVPDNMTWNISRDTVEMGGQVYSYGLSGNGTVTFNLNGDYQTFSYVVGAKENYIDSNGPIIYEDDAVRIYCDGDLVREYSEARGTLSENMSPETDSIDVSNCVTLTIEFDSTFTTDGTIADIVLDKGHD